MPNTVRTGGKKSIESLINAVKSREASQIIDLLDVHDKASYDRAGQVLKFLMMNTPDTKENPYGPLMSMLTKALQQYEREKFKIQKSKPAQIVSFLMAQHQLTQADLAEDFGGQPAVSYFLKGQRELNKRQIEALSRRFNISPAVFFKVV